LANHQSFKVSKIIFHWKTQQDAALIRLFSSEKSGKCIQWSRTAQPACLLKSAVSDERQKCFISGWGDTDSTTDDIRKPTGLQKSSADLIDFEECRKSLSESARKFVLYDQKHICTKGLGNLCQGDSGSPLICYPQRKGKCGKAILAGIATQADQCSSTTPGIFTSVEKLFHWIKSTIRSEIDAVFNSTMVCQTAQC